MPSTPDRFIPASALCCDMPLTPAQRRLRMAAWIGLALWLVAAMAGPALQTLMGLSLNAQGYAHVYAHGHPFVDARTWHGIPNALDVASNLPLALVGFWGIFELARFGPRGCHKHTRQALAVFFAGLVFTCVGSSIFHWAPDAQGLVWDRAGMAVTFAGAMALAVAERLCVPAARSVLVVTLALGLISAMLPLAQNNVMPWAVVQFGGVALLLWAALQKPLPRSLGISLGALLAWYAVAKLLEQGDAPVFHALGGWVSGHTLKHLAAAMAAWPVIRAMRQNARAIRTSTRH